MHVTKKKFLSGHFSEKKALHQSLTHGEFENLCFVSVSPMVCMSCVFVYDAVNINKIIVIHSTKPPSYLYV